MTQKEQIEAFTGDIWNLIDRYRSEFDLCTASAVGVLHLVAWNLINEAQEDIEG